MTNVVSLRQAFESFDMVFGIGIYNASRGADRVCIARTLMAIGEKHGAEVECTDEPVNPGFHGRSIVLKISLNGVGATIDIDDLLGGQTSLISWYNTRRYARDFTTRFSDAVGGGNRNRPHHKETSQPSDWYSLAMMLDAGLCLAARGEAFEPIKP